MSNYLVNGTALSYEAARIRAKTGSTNQITFDENKGFGDAIDEIPTGGGQTRTLLASGTYTNLSDVAGNIGITIPVTYSGTPTDHFVSKTDAVAVANQTQGVDWFGYHDTPSQAQPVFEDGKIDGFRLISPTGTYQFGYPLANTLTINSITVKAASSSHYLKAGTYAWYIWGYTT